MSNSKHGISNRNQHLEIQYSLFDILRFKNIIAIARRNGRAFSSLAAIGGGLPGVVNHHWLKEGHQTAPTRTKIVVCMGPHDKSENLAPQWIIGEKPADPEFGIQTGRLNGSL
jgi:hypothetical protein